MDLFIYLDATNIELDDFDKVSGPICESISEWVEQNPTGVVLVDQRGTESDGDSLTDLPALGIHLTVKRKAQLKAPLSYFYDLAKQHKQEFVLGILDKSTGATEEVCYFGFEEGKPDAFEVSNYVGL
ncbi:MAG: hypothetical protein V7752_20460 [Halopseudomonas sp.]